MNKTRQNLIPMLLIDAIILLVLLSWFVNMWGGGIRSLLSPDGIRWFFGSFVENIESAPWGLLILILLTAGAVKESEIIDIFKGNGSLKQKRALTITSVVLILLYIPLICMTIFGDILLSPFGEITNSPLIDGLAGFVLVTIIILSDIYGYISGAFSDFYEVLQGNSYFIRKKSLIFLNFILVAELYCSLIFVGILNEDSIYTNILKYLMFLIPFI